MKNQTVKDIIDVSEKTEYPFRKIIKLKCAMPYSSNKTYPSKYTYLGG